VLSERGSVFNGLFNSSFGYSSLKTADANGVSTSGLSSTPTKVTYPSGQRFGILSQPSFLVAWSAPEVTMPVERGKFVREQVLCDGVVGAPPPNIPKLPTDPTRTVRERLRQHTADPLCWSCHRKMDPIGLTLEQYDHVGRFRTEELGKPVDTSGMIYDLNGRDFPLTGPGALSSQLAQLPEVRQCFVRQSFRYWMGRREQAADACSLSAADSAMTSSGDELEALVVALFTSDSFLYRR
jgi:hypothetical protein